MESRAAGFNINTAAYAITAICILIMLIYVPAPFAISHAPDISKYGVKITHPDGNQMVTIGELTIYGIATYDTVTSECTVYADWNNLQPIQKATPTGMNYTEFGRTNDYSRWFFTYTDKYPIISEGTNELTAKLSCDIGPFNAIKYDSVNVIGIPH